MASLTAQFGGPITRLKLFLALSRTPHGLLDMTMPVAAALLWLGHFPPLGVSLLGLFTVFAGYTAVYAVNDLADFKVDRDNYQGGRGDTSGYLDAVYARHPMAMGLLTRREGLVWAACWGLAALVGAYVLNPVCAGLLLAGCALEVVYCMLLKVSHLRSLINAIVKSLGGVAAILAVDPGAPWWFPALLLLTTSAWEVGGQNIPADWFDLEEDQRQGARTLCVALGVDHAAKVAYYCLCGVVAGTLALLLAAPMGFGFLGALLGAGIVGVLLLPPGLALYRRKGRGEAAALFNRASYFPVALLGYLLVWMIFA